MKRFALVGLLALVLSTGAVFADHPKGWGIGAMWRGGFFGTAAGHGGAITFKAPSLPVFWGISFGAGSNSDTSYFSLGLTGDYYFLDQKISGPLGWYVGIGGFGDFYSHSYKYQSKTWTYSYLDLGARLPVGLSLQPLNFLEFFLDIAPSIGLGIDFEGKDKDYPINGGVYHEGGMGVFWGAPVELGFRFWF
jgi:hypothetical protein